MSSHVWVSVPERALGGLTETLLRVGLAAAVKEHLGVSAEIDLSAHDETQTTLVHVVPGSDVQTDRRAADELVRGLTVWLDDVLGSPAPGVPRRARVELEIDLHPQCPQRNPQVVDGERVTSVTTWG